MSNSLEYRFTEFPEWIIQSTVENHRGVPPIKGDIIDFTKLERLRWPQFEKYLKEGVFKVKERQFLFEDEYNVRIVIWVKNIK